MTIMVPISADAKAAADDLVRRGRFHTVEAAIEAGLRQLCSRDPSMSDDREIEDEAWIADARAKVDEGRAQVARGEVLTADEVFQPVLDRLRCWPA